MSFALGIRSGKGKQSYCDALAPDTWKSHRVIEKIQTIGNVLHDSGKKKKEKKTALMTHIDLIVNEIVVSSVEVVVAVS